MKIKNFFSTLLAMSFVSFNTRASNISHFCSNAFGTIIINNYSTLKVVTHKYDATGAPKEQSEMFHLNNDFKVEVKERLIAEKLSNCSFTETTSMEKISIKRLNGKKIPNAYSRNVDKEGILSDIFLCVESKSWLPSPGSCK